MKTGRCSKCGKRTASQEEARLRPDVEPAHLRTASLDTDLQNYCVKCKKQLDKDRAARAKAEPDAREKAADPAEKRWVMALLHERGQHTEPNPHCHICVSQ
jgi:hypothetical protein